MFDCLSRPSSSFDNDLSFMNQSSSFASSFTQLPPMNSQRIDLVNGIGNYNQPTNPANNSLAPFHRFTPGPPGTQYVQQNFGQYRNSTPTPLGFTDNEFPSLSMGGNRGAAGYAFGNFGQYRGGIGFGRAGYANLMKQPNADRSQPEFQIQNEDFPALPKAQSDMTSITGKKDETSLLSGVLDGAKADRILAMRRQEHQQELSPRENGIQTHPDGRLTGIPPGLLCDQFGMAGLLTVIRAVPNEHSVISLALGEDLTKLGIDLNTPEKNLYQNFAGPWTDLPCRPQDVDCPVPPEYMVNAAVMDTLSPVKLNRYGEDLLFYLFYNFCGEIFQLAAAAELYNRDWRYHKEQRVWISRAPGVDPVERTTTYEKGTYFIFDPSCWRKVQREFQLEYSKLEDRPLLPPQQAQPLLMKSSIGAGISGLPSGVHNS